MTSTPAKDRRTLPTGPLLAGYGLGVGAVVAYTLAALSPATATTITASIGYFTAAVAGAVCLAGLVLVVIGARPDDRGVIDPDSFRAHLAVERISPIWLVSALVMVVVQAAADAGGSAARLLASGKIGAGIGASETARGWLAVAVAAALIAVGSRLTLRWEWHVPLLIPALIGVVAVPVTGTTSQGPNHDYATGSIIVFAIAVSVWAGIAILSAVAPAAPEVRARVTAVARAAAGIAILYGAVLLALRAGIGNLVATGYGRLGLIAAVALLVGIRVIGPALAITALAALSLMAVQVAPLLLTTEPTICNILLGYQLPGGPTPVGLLSFWRFDPFLGVAALALLGGYLAGVLRLRRRGDSWPVGRTVSWFAGCTALLVATSSGVRSYGSAMFSIHMVEHMMLNMFVPVLLVLGAPVTLALRVLPAAAPGSAPGPREWITRLVHSPITTFLSSPATAFVLFVGSLYAVYFTPLFDTLVRYHWGHELMAVHFLLTGYLFYWGIIGVDPGPRRLPFIGRLVLLFAIMPFHAFFGIAMMTMTSTVGGNFYRSLALPWVSNLNDDQHLGGAIAWAASEVPLVLVVIALVTQWARQDRRTSVRADRHADAGYDDDMAAYNNMLRELARQRTNR